MIEAPFAVASDRIVTKDKITAIYTKNENGVIDILKERELANKKETAERKSEQGARDAARLAEIRKDLGIHK